MQILAYNPGATQQDFCLNTSPTLSDLARQRTDRLTRAIGQYGVRYGISANAVTIGGTVLAGVAALLIATGSLVAAGLLLIVAMPLDAIDGAIARAAGTSGKFGALLDSTLDRYADGCLLLGLLFYFAEHDQMPAAVIAGVALIGTYAVSYVRARGEGLGYPTRDGIFTRFERTVLLIAMLLTGLVVPGVIVLAIGTQVTAVQRLVVLHRLMQAVDPIKR